MIKVIYHTLDAHTGAALLVMESHYNITFQIIENKEEQKQPRPVLILNFKDKKWRIYQRSLVMSLLCAHWLTVDAPMANATKSVMDVTVMETPACFMVSATFSGSGFCFSGADRLFHASIITNMSSTPKPVNHTVYR